MCKIFSSNSANITHSPLEVEPLITNMVVPLRGAVRVRSCATPKVPIEQCMGKIHVRNFHIPKLAILYIQRFVSTSSIEVPTASKRENVRQKGYWGYTEISPGHGTPCLGRSSIETRN